MVRGSRWLKFSWWWGSEPPGMWRAIWPGRRLYWGTGVKTAPRRWQWVGPWGRGSKIRSHSGGEHWNKRWLGVSSVLLVGIAELWSVICDNRLYVWESVQHTVMISKIQCIRPRCGCTTFTPPLKRFHTAWLLLNELLKVSSHVCYSSSISCEGIWPTNWQILYRRH